MQKTKNQLGVNSNSTVQPSNSKDDGGDDSMIDTSDIPEMTKEDFAGSKRGVFYRPNMRIPKILVRVHSN